MQGELVYVPLGRRNERGCVLETHITGELECEENKVKSIGDKYELELVIEKNLLNLFKWVANYYHYPLGQHIFDCLPRPLRRPKQLKSFQGKGQPLDFNLNELQNYHYKKIVSHQGFNKWLIHGITGSGKTAIYMSVISDILASGKSVLFLLPEINLTPQFLQTFERHCSCPIYTYHSALSNSDRYGLWKQLCKDHSPKIILGVRSSVFLPIRNLGLIIVDEEHDASFKQETRCPYNARDVAIKRAQLLNIPIVLGSATPALETYYQFKNLENNYLVMNQRVGKGRPSSITILDAKMDKENEHEPFSIESVGKIQLALEKKEQVLVFVNRLGFASFMQCRACGTQFDCPNCSTSLKYYKYRSELSCQYCDYKQPAPEQCPKCSNMNLVHGSFGTEKLAEVLRKAFPNHVIERFDRDDIKTFSKLGQRLEAFHRGEIDILVGTQMLSKGHNFKRVNLVLILGIDAQLNFPDFRSNERVFQLISQVSGRGGRFNDSSEVVIQTFNPQNSIFSHIKSVGNNLFYQDELKARSLCQCPPFSRLAMVYLTSKTEDIAMTAAQEMVEGLNTLKAKYFNKIDVLGPRPALVEKKVNKYTWCLLIRSTDINHLHNSIRSMQDSYRPHRSISLKLDIDPIQIH